MFIKKQVYRFRLFKTFQNIYNVFYVLLLKFYRKNFEKQFSSIIIKEKNRLANKTHLYVVPTTNLFYLEGLSRWNRAKRSRNQSARSSASRHEFRQISNIFELKRLYRPAATIYLLLSYALCYQPSAPTKPFD